MCSSDILLALLAILFPPIAVWIKSGICTADSLINILLCMLGYIPGLLHAWYIISLYPEPDHEYEYIGDAESGQPQRVTYYYVDTTNGSGGGESQRTSAGQEGGDRGSMGLWRGRVRGGVPPTYEQAIKGGH
ncbi:MAG: hypothetical protein OHK93_005675 [Ramalina farinacea]|uniref:Stress response RCI peptide n=1 Tax=Ramalina farinacea TaxID=258253 RepID=A0AA43QH64_9LECA|nr:hypothetical protein [Ramalina farinacea]